MIHVEFLRSLVVLGIVLGEVILIVAMYSITRPVPITEKVWDGVSNVITQGFYPESPSLENVTVPQSLLLNPGDAIPEWSLKTIYTTLERNVLNKVFFPNLVSVNLEMPSISINSVKKVFTGLEFVMYAVIVCFYARFFADLPMLNYLIIPILIAGAFKQMAK